MSQAGTSIGLRQPGRYIAQLESLRGWAILLVVAFHAFGISTSQTDHGLPEDSALWLRIAGAGNTGVTLFFVLSGFLLSLPFIEALKSNRRISIGRFYIARLLRIVPLYYSAVLVAWLVSRNSIATLKALLFIHIGFDMFPYSVPWWSLTTEMQFYLLLPWLMLALRWQLGRWLVGGVLATWLGAHCFYLLAQQQRGWPQIFWLEASLFGRGTAFLCGGLCGWFYLSRGFAHRVRSRKLGATVSLALLVTLLTLLQWYGLKGQIPAQRILPLYHDLETLIWAGLMLCSLTQTGSFARVLLNPAMEHFGKISYSLYIVHVPIFVFCITRAKQAVGSSFSWDTRIALAIVASFVLSWLLAILCYRMIERPFLKLKAHLPVLTERLRGHLASV